MSDLRDKFLNSKIKEYLIVEDECVKLLKSNEEMLPYCNTDYDILFYREENLKYLNEKIKILIEIKKDIKYFDSDHYILNRNLPTIENPLVTVDIEEINLSKNT